MRFLYPRLLLIALCLAVAPSAMAATWYVDGNNGDDGNDCKTPQTACATIGHVILLAASGDTIKIAAATYQENLSIPFKLTLTGAKAATTIVDGTNSANVFTVGAGISLKLSNLTIKNGVGYSGGGGVNNAGTLTVNKSNFYTNVALSCGAIDNRSTMTITTSTFYSNYANNNSTAGGAICNGGTLSIKGTTFNTNSSQGNNGGYGGAIYNYAGTLSVTNSTFSQNSATTSGGAIYSQGGTVQIANSTFGINPATSGGGGGALSNAGGSVLIQNSIVANIG